MRWKKIDLTLCEKTYAVIVNFGKPVLAKYLQSVYELRKFEIYYV